MSFLPTCPQLYDPNDHRGPIAAAVREVGLAVVAGSAMLFGNVRSVLNYGADPTGVADSRAAFQAAVAALGGLPGIVFVPPGVYLISTVVPTASVILAATGQAIVGSGIGVTLIRYSSAGVRVGGFGFTPFQGGINIFPYQPVDNLRFESMTIQDTNAAFNASTSNGAIVIIGTSNAAVRDVEFIDCKGNGCIYAEGMQDFNPSRPASNSGDLIVEGCYFHGSFDVGVNATIEGDGINANMWGRVISRRNRFKACARFGMEGNFGNELHVSSSDVESCAVGFGNIAAKRVSITDCHFFNMAPFTNSVVGAAPVRCVSFSIEGTTQVEIENAIVADNVVQGNYCYLVMYQVPDGNGITRGALQVRGNILRRGGTLTGNDNARNLFVVIGPMPAQLDISGNQLDAGDVNQSTFAIGNLVSGSPSFSNVSDVAEVHDNQIISSPVTYAARWQQTIPAVGRQFRFWNNHVGGGASSVADRLAADNYPGETVPANGIGAVRVVGADNLNGGILTGDDVLALSDLAPLDGIRIIAVVAATDSIHWYMRNDTAAPVVVPAGQIVFASERRRSVTGIRS